MNRNLLAQVAYRAYGNWVAWKTADGHTMPEWSQLSDNLQNAWTAAIAAVADDIAQENVTSIEGISLP
jgi:hypothetical protein